MPRLLGAEVDAAFIDENKDDRWRILLVMHPKTGNDTTEKGIILTLLPPLFPQGTEKDEEN